MVHRTARTLLALVTLALLAPAPGCRRERAAAPPQQLSLERARRGFRTHVTLPEPDRDPAPAPPAGMFELVHYRSPAGELAAYVTPRPPTPGRRPAIVWLHGGFSNSIGPTWDAQPDDNDQSAAVFREAGVVLMLPSLRGGNDNPGANEGFLGEVDDAVAAADHLAALDYVDPARVYLGGHSTGGTLALLVAERTDRFRAVFSFGPIDDVSGYGADVLPLGDDPQEALLRSPVHFMSTIRTPTWVIEGGAQGNAAVFPALRVAAAGAPVRFRLVSGASHFSVIRPASALVARKIVADVAPATPLTITDEELRAAQAPPEPYRGGPPPDDASPVTLTTRLLDPAYVVAENLAAPALDGWLARVAAAAREHLASSPQPAGMRFRVVLHADDQGAVRVALAEGSTASTVLPFVQVFFGLERPRTRRDPVRIELTVLARGASP